VSLVKSGELLGTGVAGDTVRFSFEVVNTGGGTLTGVVVVDPLPGLSTLTYGPWPGPVGELGPEQVVTATADYVLSQADVDAGLVTNTATVQGTAADGEPRGDQATAVITIVPRAELSLDKTVRYAPGGEGREGDGLVYDFTVANTGTVTVTGVAVADEMPGLGEVVYGSWPGEPGVLAPGQSVTARATYTVTAADVAAGSVSNTATAIGTSADPAVPGPTGDDDTAVAPTHPRVLAFTGAEPGALGLLALLTLTTGLWLVVGGRRRTRSKGRP
jgi:uncharacterized repeat protein (TIGR01451 family)